MRSDASYLLTEPPGLSGSYHARRGGRLGGAHRATGAGNLLSARAGNRHFRRLSTVRAHTKPPYKTDFLWKSLRALNRPWTARAVKGCLVSVYSSKLLTKARRAQDKLLAQEEEQAIRRGRYRYFHAALYISL
jgi:hypothetical protein